MGGGRGRREKVQDERRCDRGKDGDDEVWLRVGIPVTATGLGGDDYLMEPFP